MNNPLGVSPSKGKQGTTRDKEKNLLTSVGIEPTTSGLDLPSLCRLSYKVALFLNLFMTNSQVHRYDTRTAGNYRVHSCRTNIKKLTILNQGPRVWNCIPASITNLSSFSTFKNKMLEFILKEFLS